MSRFLLPSGLRDLLPPDAARQAALTGRLLAHFARFGYARVTPPLLEFEETMLAGREKALAHCTFRFMDPLSRRMLALRSDITVQVARIAASRLAGSPLPLRLSYTGSVLRAQPERLSSDRQHVQAGIEMIGSRAPSADAEVVYALAEALAELGFSGLVADLSLAGLAEALLAEETPETAAQALEAIRHKDASALPEALARREAIRALLASGGDTARALETLAALRLPPAAEALAGELRAVLACLPSHPVLRLTADPLEGIGFGYHHGVCFSLFLAATRREIGRGGRYAIAAENPDAPPLPATGGTLYVSRLLEAWKADDAPRRVYAPPGVSPAETAALRAQGLVTVHGHEGDGGAEKQGCVEVYKDGNMIKLGKHS